MMKAKMRSASNMENNDEELAAESTGSNVELSAQKASTDAS